MNIGIIGAGPIGQAVARHASPAGHRVVVSNSRGPASLSGLASQLGPLVAASSVQEAAGQDIVILAVPFGVRDDAIGQVGDWHGRILVDATNTFTVEHGVMRPVLISGLTTTEALAQRNPEARVVKAFNTLPAALLAAPGAVGGRRRVLFLSGDDDAAVSQVAVLIRSFGFEPRSLGPLAAGAPMQQAGGPLALFDVLAA
jgi:predicted dinucleotide-binding enzyme